MEKVFLTYTFKDRINVINKSLPNRWRAQCRSYSSVLRYSSALNTVTLDLINKDVIELLYLID